jgi:hypothetical protein
MTCASCGRPRNVAFSHRLGKRACWDCYHAGFTEEEVAQAEQIGRQGKIAASIRAAAERVSGRRREQLRERALLIEASSSPVAVVHMIEEVEALGFQVRRAG